MAQVDFDYDEFRNKIPFGGITGGTPFDPSSPNFNPTFSTSSNPFGGEQEATTRAQLDAFRASAKQQGLKVDEGDREAYAQMMKGFGGLAPLVPNQFDDPYTNQLESIAKAQMGQVRSNPGLDSLMKFLTERFADLSQNPGYNPTEQAILRTQAIEPIEQDRAASTKRSLERTAARNMLPSSGLAELDLRDIDRQADQRRTVAGRDLAIAGLNRRDQDLNQALNIGQLLGLQIPQGQRGEELALANLLYQLPRTAMQDALSVVNGTPSSNDAFSQALQLLQQQQRTQVYNDQRNSEIWNQLGGILAGLFNG